jgi:hypothetical protein
VKKREAFSVNALDELDAQAWQILCHATVRAVARTADLPPTDLMTQEQRMGIVHPMAGALSADAAAFRTLLRQAYEAGCTAVFDQLHQSPAIDGEMLAQAMEHVNDDLGECPIFEVPTGIAYL